MQPAEVLGLIEIPSHVQFWGIDSGIRHRYNNSGEMVSHYAVLWLYMLFGGLLQSCVTKSSRCFYICSILSVCCSVGGADYGSVRIGAFMGRKMTKSTASSLLLKISSENGPQHLQNRLTSDEVEDGAGELLEAEASLDYLCNLPPHRYCPSWMSMLVAERNHIN